MIRRFLTICCTAVGMLAAVVTPASANRLDTVAVSATCSNYTISATGEGLVIPNVTWSVGYAIVLTPPSGSPTVVSDSLAVAPDANGNFSITATRPLGPLTTDDALFGVAVLSDSAGTVFNSVLISFSPDAAHCGPPPPPPCGTTSSNVSNFNGTPISGGDYIWFNANFSASGIPATGATVTFRDSTIQFTADQTYNLTVPNAQISFSPTATCASTTFDSATNTWNTIVPIAGSDEIFLSGLSFPVPASFANAGGLVSGAVSWQGTFGSTSNAVSISWKWGAAVYTTFSTDYNALGVKPTHTNACAYSNSDHAGTPEGVDAQSGNPFKSFVIGGARGGGGSNWTGSWSGTKPIAFSCPVSLVPGAPTNLMGFASGSTLILLWHAPISGAAPTSYVLDVGSAAGLSNLGSFPLGSLATSLFEPGVPNGTYFFRIRAVDAAGSSPASNEVMVKVGP